MMMDPMLKIEDEGSVSSNSTNKVIQNIDMLNQGDTIYFDENINDGKGMKSACQFMEECNVPCYNSTVKTMEFSMEKRRRIRCLFLSVFI